MKLGDSKTGSPDGKSVQYDLFVLLQRPSQQVRCGHSGTSPPFYGTYLDVMCSIFHDPTKPCKHGLHCECIDSLTLPLFKESSLEDFESCANIHELLSLKILLNKAYLSN